MQRERGWRKLEGFRKTGPRVVWPGKGTLGGKEGHVGSGRRQLCRMDRDRRREVGAEQRARPRWEKRGQKEGETAGSAVKARGAQTEMQGRPRTSQEAPGIFTGRSQEQNRTEETGTVFNQKSPFKNWYEVGPRTHCAPIYKEGGDTHKLE